MPWLAVPPCPTPSVCGQTAQQLVGSLTAPSAAVNRNAVTRGIATA